MVLLILIQFVLYSKDKFQIHKSRHHYTNFFTYDNGNASQSRTSFAFSVWITFHNFITMKIKTINTALLNLMNEMIELICDLYALANRLNSTVMVMVVGTLIYGGMLNFGFGTFVPPSNHTSIQITMLFSFQTVSGSNYLFRVNTWISSAVKCLHFRLSAHCHSRIQCNLKMFSRTFNTKNGK